jgi:hypothetical protein
MGKFHNWRWRGRAISICEQAKRLPRKITQVRRDLFDRRPFPRVFRSLDPGSLDPKTNSSITLAAQRRVLR